MQKEGFWVREKYILKMNEYHIHYIIENPEVFNLSKKEVYDCYEKFGERIGIEGRAREELIKLVTNYGWIRVRHYVRPRDYWSIQCDDINKRVTTIVNFLYSMVYTFKMIRSNEEIEITGFKDELKYVYSFKDGGIMAYLHEYSDIPKVTMVLGNWSKPYLGEIGK